MAEITRRDGLRLILASACAPFFVPAERLMRLKPIVVPEVAMRQALLANGWTLEITTSWVGIDGKPCEFVEHFPVPEGRPTIESNQLALARGWSHRIHRGPVPPDPKSDIGLTIGYRALPDGESGRIVVPAPGDDGSRGFSCYIVEKGHL